MTVTCNRSSLKNLAADSYLLRHDEPVEYWIKRLVKGSLAWRYVGATHEYLTCDVPEVTRRLDAIVIHHHADSGTRHEKFGRDLNMLLAEHVANRSDPRTVFYLAQTYRDLGRHSEASELQTVAPRRVEVGATE
jgi:hypothetical protein